MPIKLNGQTNGSVTLTAPATGSDVTVTIPSSSNATMATSDTAYTFSGISPSNRNKIINGGFDIWQRGTSFNSATGYTADRWTSLPAYPTNISQQTFTPGNQIEGYESNYFLRSVASGGNLPLIQQRIEDVRTLAGQTSTISFWMKADSASSFTVYFDQNFGSGGSTQVGNIAVNTFSVTTSWARYSFTASLPSISGKTIGTSSYLQLTIYGAANRTMDLWGVQLERGSSATTFETENIGDTLRKCQRYYYRLNGGANAGVYGMGICFSATGAGVIIPFPITMRTRPTAIEQSGTANHYSVWNSSGNQIFFSSVPTYNTITTESAAWVNITVASGLTAGNATGMYSANASSYLAWSVEL